MDFLKSIGSICLSILALVVMIMGLANDAALVGFILGGILIFISYKCLNSLSQETLRAAAALEPQKEYQKMNGGYKCPSCGKMAGHEMSAFSKGASVSALGLASNKIGKTYKCANCNYMW